MNGSTEPIHLNDSDMLSIRVFTIVQWSLVILETRSWRGASLARTVAYALRLDINGSDCTYVVEINWRFTLQL